MARLLVLVAFLASAQVPEPGRVRTVEDPAFSAFSAKLAFDGTAEERALFEGLVRRILQSPTLAGLAARFAAEPGTVSTRFGEFPGTSLYERREGRLAFDAKVAAHVQRGLDAAHIVLNGACLSIDPEYALEQCSSQLAHEALGHTLGWLEAGPLGVRAAYVYYDDEQLARLAQWTLSAERGERVLDPEAWCALKSPEPFARRLSATYSSSIDATRHLAEVRTVAESPLGPALELRAEMLRQNLLAKPELFFAIGDCSDYL